MVAVRVGEFDAWEMHLLYTVVCYTWSLVRGLTCVAVHLWFLEICSSLCSVANLYRGGCPVSTVVFAQHANLILMGAVFLFTAYHVLFTSICALTGS